MTDLRGTVVRAGPVRTVSTRYGSRDLAEVRVRPDDGKGAHTLTLWGDWAETATLLDPGMTVSATGLTPGEWDGEPTAATTGDSFVVVEPDYLVDVTAVRAWTQCPRIHYLNEWTGVPLAYPVVKGTIVHEVFGDLLRGRDLDDAVGDAVADAGLELGLLDRDADAVAGEVRDHARAIRAWLDWGTLADDDGWRSEYTLISPRFGLKGRCDALRRGMPVELKTGKNTGREARFPDKVQAACYALMLRERGLGTADTGTLLYTANAALDRAEATGDLSPAKEFSIGHGLLAHVVRSRNALAAAAIAGDVPTGEEADAVCEYCFERDACMVVAGRLDQRSKAGAIGAALPAAERAYLGRFARLIEAERRAVHAALSGLWTQDPAARADADRALIDLEPAGRRRLADGRWDLRARGTGAVSKIRAGDVVLASDGDPVRGRAEVATVERLGDEVVVTADEPVALRRLDVYPSEFGTGRMRVALHDVVLKGTDRRRDVLIGRRSPAFSAAGVPDGVLDGLNPAQTAAVKRALAAEDCALVHGPPGTGKTHTIARLVAALVDRGERVLLSAFTNRAVDNALEALLDAGVRDADVVRMGTEHGIRGDMRPLRLDPRGDPEERAAALRGSAVVAATTSTCGSRVMRTQGFDAVVVDEASQLKEPATLAAIARGDRFVLVGDHRQLPPVVRSGGGLSRSLFERLMAVHPDAAVMLDRQYRMGQAIQAFPSREFYGGRLRPATHAVAARGPGDIADIDALPPWLRRPVSFLDVRGDDADHTDAAEAERVAEVVDAYRAAGVDPSDVGVITPFRAQVATIDDGVPDAVTVDTVDRFQGSDEAVIVISFVATGALSGPIFEDHRRLNVALTRARNALVLVGDARALRSEPRYARMLDWADRD